MVAFFLSVFLSAFIPFFLYCWLFSTEVGVHFCTRSFLTVSGMLPVCGHSFKVMTIKDTDWWVVITAKCKICLHKDSRKPTEVLETHITQRTLRCSEFTVACERPGPDETGSSPAVESQQLTLDSSFLSIFSFAFLPSDVLWFQCLSV